MNSIRLLIDSPGDGAWNMAVDEALWREADRSRLPVLRFYAWLDPTVSLGYFQRVSDRGEHACSRDLPFVRRSTGGGAIVHDHEMTYSLVWPTSEPRTDSLWLYHVVHEALREVFRELGVALDIVRSPIVSRSRHAPFLCFARRAVGDVLLGRHKVLGSAQRRSRTALLQHGSLLWKRSRWAPELAGIAELAVVGCKESEVRRSWAEQIAARLECQNVPSVLSESERNLADKIRTRRYRADNWNFKR